ncbi:hypothetical protein [Streptomyces sp. RK62]|uniref:hypothetical protein n=1 Tax=Streptomyces sp. RK62 TaxID=2824893 RepID=UPI001B36C6DC|nr:hypothetical protein [Streptomyces sp. RK62]MBQ0995878.1 hypothetical protein [Streptomyces sp. RK62]
METPTAPTAFYVTFNDYLQDPNDSDILRRAMTVYADRLTFDSDHLTFWLTGSEVGRFLFSIIESIRPQADLGRQRESPEELRARYPKMGEPWTQEDDTHLLALYQQGERDLETLGTQFDRKPSAIRSRLAN